MEKDGPREGVVSVAGFIPSSEWGFPGVGGAEHVIEVPMPGNAKPGMQNMGTIILKLQYHVEVGRKGRGGGVARVTTYYPWP